MSERVNAGLVEAGVELVLGAEVTGLDLDGDRVTGVHWDGGSREADLVVVAIGVRPATGVPRTGTRAWSSPTTARCAPTRTAGWPTTCGPPATAARCAAGSTTSGSSGPLGTHATKHGRALGDSLAGGTLSFDGMVDTAITRFSVGDVHLEIARTGLSRADAEAAGHDPVALVTEGTTASGYMPEAEPIALWVMADRTTRRLLGVQVVGGHGAGKRIDAAAAVLWAGGTVDDLAWMDLAYAPPFATAWEILQVAARRVAERL